MSTESENNQFSIEKNLAYMQGKYSALVTIGFTMLSFAGGLISLVIGVELSQVAEASKNIDIISQFLGVLQFSAVMYGLIGAVIAGIGISLNWYRFKHKNKPITKNAVLFANSMAKGSYVIIIEGSLSEGATAGCQFKEIIENTSADLKQLGHKVKKVTIASDLGVKEV